MASGSPTLVWFRDDLRLADNGALHAAAKSGRPVVAVYVLDDSPGIRELGGAARWWLHHSLAGLDESLRKHGLRLVLRRGPARQAIPEMAAECGATSVFWNRRYREPERKIDEAIKASLKSDGMEVESFAGTLLHEPFRVQTGSGKPYRVFTPFWKTIRGNHPPAPLPAPRNIAAGPRLKTETLDSLCLLPTKPDWAGGLRRAWTPGEAGARKALRSFLSERGDGYASDRDRPDREATSRLSPHLRFGEISPGQIWHALHTAVHDETFAGTGHDAEKFLAELGWREFCWHLLFHEPRIETENLQKRFDAFQWRGEPSERTAWQRGRTGYPIVDAGMRQLWQTGWMHNRVRMIVASFLIKHLMIDWRDGEAWFWDTLVDADPASNVANWQWVAGSGADAAPFFRIFNPILQGKKFDPAGDYVRQFVPELKKVPPEHIHEPWNAPDDILAKAGVRLGPTYPLPVVDHGRARSRALAAFAKLPKD